MKLLTPGGANAKLAKSATTHGDYRSFILHLSPADTCRAGVNLCPASTPGCRASCLATAGRARFANVVEARHRRTALFIDHRDAFMSLLCAEIDAAMRKHGTGCVAIRLNGTSDIAWEDIPARGAANVFEAFPTVIFWDYTKRPERAARSLAREWPKNYHLVFSRSEANERVAHTLYKRGASVAVVFDKALPASYWGKPVHDGTAHDYRFLDPDNSIVGLVGLGAARQDTSGFVVRQ